MKFMYQTYKPLFNKHISNQLNNAADRLGKKLNQLKIAELAISQYNAQYLAHDHLNNLTSTLQKYVYILGSCIQSTQLPINEITFLEYGGGIGILSLLAREVGVKSVLYNDIYNISVQDAQNIATHLGLTANHYIPGDIDDVINYLKNNNIACHAVGSYDVIEHVYDIDVFLKKLSSLSKAKNFTLFMSSGANTLNPRIKNKLIKHHHEHEYQTRQTTSGHKQRDCLEGFLSVRRNIIKEYAPALSNAELNHLAQATRGKIKNDIHTTIDTYKKNKLLPAIPITSDTCDPHTGNWSEHLLDPYHLKNILYKQGLDAQVLCGYYGHQSRTIKKYVCNLFNACITFAPTTLALRLAPFYTIYGKKN